MYMKRWHSTCLQTSAHIRRNNFANRLSTAKWLTIHTVKQNWRSSTRKKLISGLTSTIYSMTDWHRIKISQFPLNLKSMYFCLLSSKLILKFITKGGIFDAKKHRTHCACRAIKAQARQCHLYHFIIREPEHEQDTAGAYSANAWKPCCSRARGGGAAWLIT